MPTMSKDFSRQKRHRRLRRKVAGTVARPRLLVRRTLHHIYATVVDDTRGHTMLSTSTRNTELAAGLQSRTNLEAARKVGMAIAQKAKAAGIAQVIFDTSGLKYHGRVKALADSAREAGLEF
ncbi:MAG: 50S ribosomal protein L18 [Candidatus Eremiobacteraeota bacterium]|nr:50S ribosomal protein L18 [Candidatus Eremiobacteraeota bacterium]